ncbi:MAG: pentapeptide repeat-containing protein [Spirochaetes bacterium]|nr:MAG: pentapeptide repeat-containing protein [Spirochaetota bacterium]
MKKLSILLATFIMVGCASCPTTPDKIVPHGNYSGCNLAGFKMKGKDLTGANFEGANLVGADMRMTDFDRTNFKNSNLSSSNLFAAAGSAFFYNANLSHAKWVNGNFCSIGSTGKCVEVK